MTDLSIEQLLQGRSAITIGPELSVRSACILLDAHNIGALAVVSQEQLLGILSERDVIRRCIAAGLPTDHTRVAEIMTADPVKIQLQARVDEAFATMMTGRFRHLPVMAGRRLVGMLSLRDIPPWMRHHLQDGTTG